MKTNLTAPKRKRRDFYTMHGGDPVLDFVNSMENGSTQPHDMLMNYESFINWCHRAMIIDYDYSFYLDFEGYCNVKDAEQVHKKVLSARGILHEVVLNAAAGCEVHEAYMGSFNRLVDEALLHLRYHSNGNGIHRMWENVDTDLAVPLYMIIEQAARLLVSTDAERIKKCDGCGLFFFDKTKNATRRWCSPLLCGSKFKLSRIKKTANRR